MNFRKSVYLLLVVIILFFGFISKTLWAYRGSTARRCMRKAIEIINEGNDDIEKIKELIEKANKDNRIYQCNFDYAMLNSEIVIYCKEHGNGSNIEILNDLSINSYYGNRFNHTAGLSTFILGVFSFIIWIIRFIAFKVFKNKK